MKGWKKFLAITTLGKITRTIDKATGYISNSAKTFSIITESVLVTTFECSVENAENDFLNVQNIAKNIKGDYTKVGGNNILAWQIYQSFSPQDNITDEQAHNLGKELADKFLGGKYQYVLATHNDKKHIHNHIIFNACSFENFKKFRTDREKEYVRLRQISDNICKENNLTITPYESNKKLEKSKKIIENDNIDLSKKDKTFKQILENDLLKVLPQSINFNNFLERMKMLGYEVIDDKFGLGFKNENQKYFTRVSSLGTEFSRDEIEKYLKDNKNIKSKLEETKPKNNTIQAKNEFDLIDPKEILKSRISWRTKLKYCIDYYIFKSKTYDEFLNGMVEAGYTIKYGKHISFRCQGMDKSIRSKVLGEDYTEERIKERVLDKNKLLPKVPNIQQPKKQYNSKEKVSIKKLIDITQDSKYKTEIYYQKYVKRHNTDIMIATDNFMRKYKYNENTLTVAINDIKQRVLKDSKELLSLEKDFENLSKIKVTEENREKYNLAYENLTKLKNKLEKRIKENKISLEEHKVVKENLKTYDKNQHRTIN